MPPSYRQANSSGYAVKGGEVNGYTTSSSGSSPTARKPIDPTVLYVGVAGQTIISNLW